MPADSLVNAVNEEIILPHDRTSNPHDNVLETFRPSSSPHVFGNGSYEGKDCRREKGDGIFRLAYCELRHDKNETNDRNARPDPRNSAPFPNQSPPTRAPSL
jgi:hypothetical protein